MLCTCQVRAHHRMVHCPKRKGAGLREFSDISLEKVVEEVEEEKESKKLAAEQHEQHLVAAQAAGRKANEIGAAFRMLSQVGHSIA